MTLFHKLHSAQVNANSRRCRPVRFRLSLVLMALALVEPLFLGTPGLAASYHTATVDMRGKNQLLAIYDPASGTPWRPFQVIITSGDVGWVGLAVDIAEHLQKAGYRTIGFNARAYLSSFTGNDISLKGSDIPGDYRTLIDWAISQKTGPAEFIMVGVSEGAGLAVIGMSEPGTNLVCRGTIALGLPALTSLGWRWTDFPMWFTKKEPREPLADTRTYLPRLRNPLVMIHSTNDEYDSLAKAKEMFQLVPGPKRFVAIDAVNHRFSDRIAEVLQQVDKALQWFQNPLPE